MKIVLSSDEIKRLLNLAVTEGWLEPDCNFTPDVQSIELVSELSDGRTIINAIVDIGDLE